RPQYLALPGVHREPGAVPYRREALYGPAQMGPAVLRRARYGMTDTEDGIREFARVTPTSGSPEMGRFLAALRRLQDITVAADPDDIVWDDTAALLEEVCARLAAHPAPAGVAPAGRSTNLPGNGHPLMPPWQVT